MEAIYQNQWTAKFKGKTPAEIKISISMVKAEWAIGLYGLSGAEIGGAIAASRVDEEYPPNIARFRKLAKASGENWEHKGQAYQMYKKALPKPKASKEVKNAAMKELKGLLGRKTAKDTQVKRDSNIPTPEEMIIEVGNENQQA